MRTPNNEILVYYDPNSTTARKVLALARTMAPNVNEVEYHKTKFTGKMWRSLLTSLDLHPKKLLNKAHPYYQENIRGRDFDDEGWLRILIHNPDLIKAPIAIKGNNAVLCDNPSEIFKL